MEIVSFVLGAATFASGILIGFRLGSAGEAPRISLPGKVHGHFPTQEEMDDASTRQREA